MKQIFFIIILICLLFILVNNLLIYEKYENSKTPKIPKIIIQTWKTDTIPLKYKNDINTVKKYNNDYKYLFFNDNDIEIFLKKHYPIYYESYIKLPVKIQKIDYFRYIAIYHYGGFYFDLDITGLYPLDELLSYECIFPVDQNISKHRCSSKRLKKYCDKGMNILLGQYAFGAKPQNEFIKLLIDTIHNNVDKYIEEHNKNGMTLQNIYSSTGPDFVTDMYINYKNKDSIHILYYNMAQYFGKYAKHNHYGTWKY